MELWEYATYVEGYQDVYYRREVDNIVLAYQTSAFTNSSKKPKPLEHYVNLIRKGYGKDTTSDEPVNRDESFAIMENIERLKRGKNNE